jgi:hypothetical protein
LAAQRWRHPIQQVTPVLLRSDLFQPAPKHLQVCSLPEGHRSSIPLKQEGRFPKEVLHSNNEVRAETLLHQAAGPFLSDWQK